MLILKSSDSEMVKRLTAVSTGPPKVHLAALDKHKTMQEFYLVDVKVCLNQNKPFEQSVSCTLLTCKVKLYFSRPCRNCVWTLCSESSSDRDSSTWLLVLCTASTRSSTCSLHCDELWSEQTHANNHKSLCFSTKEQGTRATGVTLAGSCWQQCPSLF